MKVLLINGSPHKEGCTFTALTEIKNQFEKELGAGFQGVFFTYD